MYVERNEKAEFSAAKTEMGEEEERGEEGGEVRVGGRRAVGERVRKGWDEEEGGRAERRWGAGGAGEKRGRWREGEGRKREGRRRVWGRKWGEEQGG